MGGCPSSSLWPAEPLQLEWAPWARRRRPARCWAPSANMWSASPRDDPLHSSLRWSRAVGCWVVFETCFLNVGHPIIPVVVVMAAAAEAAARTRAVRWGWGRTKVVAVWRRPGSPRRFLDRRCAHLCSPRAPSLPRTRYSPPLPASQVRQPRGQRSASSGHAPQRRVRARARRRASEACGDGGGREGGAPPALLLTTEQQYIGRRLWRRRQQRQHGWRWRLRRCRRCGPWGRQ